MPGEEKKRKIALEHRDAAKLWLEYDEDAETRGVVEAALAGSDAAVLSQCFRKRVAFGTAGLRARMGAGTACMNTLTVIQATQGLVRYVQEQNNTREVLVVIGHDARHHSPQWAKHAAAVCKQAGASFHLYDTIVPTPLVPFAVTRLQAHAGIMITASHNPKDDNGYKVYWSNGVQIIPPHDVNIERSIVANQKPWSPEVWQAEVQPHAEASQRLLREYLETVTRTLCSQRVDNALSKPLFCYTPVHGVGLHATMSLFRMFGLPAPVVPEAQARPDPNFTTAPFPNPEEKGVLDLAQQRADAAGVPLVMANDPDADRMAVSEKGPDGRWVAFTGNEIGAMLGAWAWEKRPAGVPGDKCWMLASAVSSKFLKTMAAAEGFQFEATLTGFKWMGTRTAELTAGGKTVLFAFEEAIGYMMGAPGVLDKDGVSAAAAMGELAVACYNKRGITLREYITGLFVKYGWHVSINSYYISNDPEVTKQIFARIRNWPEEKVVESDSKRYPGELGGVEVQSVQDYDVGSDSFMTTFHFKNKATITLRTSGTEPKIKYYSEMVDLHAAEAARKALDSLVRACVEACLQPKLNGLLPARG